LNVSFEYVYITYVYIGIMLASGQSQSDKYWLVWLRSELTSDQSDDSDLPKFVQNQIRAK